MEFEKVYNREDVFKWELEDCTLVEALLQAALEDKGCPPELLELEEGELYADVFMKDERFYVILSDHQVYDEDAHIEICESCECECDAESREDCFCCKCDEGDEDEDLLLPDFDC